MNTDSDIHLLIEKYFSGNTSLEEEARLRRLLATTTEDSPEILQAKAVIGFFAVASRKNIVVTRSYRRTLWRVASVAASVIIAVVLCVGMVRIYHPDSTAKMIAYIGGVETNDPATIIGVINEDFISFQEANIIIADDIGSDFDAINEVMDF